MARISRKQTAPQSVTDSFTGNIYQAALYLRLSKEDSGYDNSDSIEMQEYLLRQYADAQPDIVVKSVFQDNGATGTNFERPGFEQMMDAVRQRDINCILVKDLSRFGRNYVETGYYLEKIFPFLGVRFVAVNDCYDTLKDTNSDEIVVALKNIVNSLLAKDISKKSGTALRCKQEKGEFIGGWTPYGYLKSPDDKHKLIIDPETAPIVREIFSWRLDKVGYSMIARRLNEQNIPCPNMLRYLRGEFKKTRPTGLGRIWQGQTIKAITNNMVYAGHMAQGKQYRSLSDGIPVTEVDKKDWIIVRNTHEAIVGEDTWNSVQAVNEQQKEKAHQKHGKRPSTENILFGLVYCADCGTKMIRFKNASNKGTIRYTFICRNYKENLNSTGCTNKSIGEPELLTTISAGIHAQIETTLEMETLLEKLNAQSEYHRQKKNIEKALRNAQAEISQNAARRASLFESYSDNLLTEEDYRFMKQQYDTQAVQLSQKLEQLQIQQNLHQKTLSPQNEWIQAFQKHKDTKILTREILLELIHHITISDYNKVEITWNFGKEFQTLAHYTEGVR